VCGPAFYFQRELPHGARSEKRAYKLATCGGLIGWASRKTDVDNWGFCPSLAELDPSDPTRLPDGSQRVAALAMAAVARPILAAEVRRGG
jgi:hypothetical protein